MRGWPGRVKVRINRTGCSRVRHALQRRRILSVAPQQDKVQQGLALLGDLQGELPSLPILSPHLSLPNPIPPPQDKLQQELARLGDLQDEHSKLLRQQEVLQAELQLALNNYQPKATINSGTPADKMLLMMSDLLDGVIPSIQDILFIQSSILESLDIYRPMDVAKQLMQATTLDVSTRGCQVLWVSTSRGGCPPCPCPCLFFVPVERAAGVAINAPSSRSRLARLAPLPSMHPCPSPALGRRTCCWF